eukprot:4168336-Prymnesium_polylepis.1
MAVGLYFLAVMALRFTSVARPSAVRFSPSSFLFFGCRRVDTFVDAVAPVARQRSMHAPTAAPSMQLGPHVTRPP